MSGELEQPGSGENDTSCGGPLRVIAAAGAVWLVVGAVMQVFCAVKLLAPGFLADSAWGTYGRVQAAADAVLHYGFALPVAFGMCAWLLSRMGRVRLAGAGMVVIAALFWNLGVAIGTAGILIGDASGFEGFQFPRYATPILFASYLLIAGCAGLTVLRRRNGALTVSQWFAAAAMGWFGWVELTANIFLLFTPASGIVAPEIAAWHARNVNCIVLGFAALGLGFHFLPKFLGRPLHSRPLALFGMWTLALFGGFGGLNVPLPAWIGAVDTAAGVLTLIPLLAIGTTFFLTARHSLEKLDSDPVLRFTYVGLVMWVIASAQYVLEALPPVRPLVEFSLFGSAREGLSFWGFFVMIACGALDYLLPRVSRLEFPFPRLRPVQFWCFLAGVGLTYFSRMVAGVAQGILLNDPANPFMIVIKTIRTPLQTACVGQVLIAAGVIAFALNVIGGLAQKKVSRAQMTERASEVEDQPIIFGPMAAAGLGVSLMISWGALVVGPIVQLGGLQQAPMTGVDNRLYPNPRLGSAERGAAVFRANGCAACHTQQVRPASMGSDMARGWGKRRSVARDYLFDQPPLPGSLRMGPDLANVGNRQNIDTFLLHLYDPTAMVRGSIMPSFRFLFESSTNGLGRRDLVPSRDARALAAYLQSLRSDAPLFEAPKVEQASSLLKGNDASQTSGRTTSTRPHTNPPSPVSPTPGTGKKGTVPDSGGNNINPPLDRDVLNGQDARSTLK